MAKTAVPVPPDILLPLWWRCYLIYWTGSIIAFLKNCLRFGRIGPGERECAFLMVVMVTVTYFEPNKGRNLAGELH